MAGKQQFTVDQVIAAIHQAQTPTGAGMVLKCAPETIRNYARRYATVKEALLSERASLVDLAEMGFKSAIINKEPWALAFALKTLGKHLGYVERQEVTGADGKPQKVEVEYINSPIKAAGLPSEPTRDQE